MEASITAPRAGRVQRTAITSVQQVEGGDLRAGADRARPETVTRVVGGTWGGRRLVTPAGETTRPTSEKVRAALASSLRLDRRAGRRRVLDLYAGSGALGLELVSRGRVIGGVRRTATVPR